jgi:hypothetical protein
MLQYYFIIIVKTKTKNLKKHIFPDLMTYAAAQTVAWCKFTHRVLLYIYLSIRSILLQCYNPVHTES